MKFSRRTTGIAASAVVVVAVAIGGATLLADQHTGSSAGPTGSAAATPTAAPYAAPAAAAIAALPEAKYNAVIAGLVGYAHSGVPKGMTSTYTIAADAPLYGDDRTTPVARLAAANFLGSPSVVVPVRTRGAWSLVLTPSRQSLPSQHPDAPAQSAGWIRTDLLTKSQSLTSHIEISVGAQTVSIVDATGTATATFPAGVGAASTPTPTGVVGYMQARYLDPAQDQTVYPIGLTSLHSSAADEPFGGKDGGLIGIHYYPERNGAISHGCVRLDGDAITKLDTLPLGTPVVIVA